MIDCKYNEPVTFLQGQIHKFPDFTIEYLGEKEVDMPPEYLGSKIKKTYKITDKNSNSEEYRWGTGTGLLMEFTFTVNGKKYSFEPWETPTKVIIVDEKH